MWLGVFRFCVCLFVWGPNLGLGHAGKYSTMKRPLPCFLHLKLKLSFPTLSLPFRCLRHCPNVSTCLMKLYSWLRAQSRDRQLKMRTTLALLFRHHLSVLWFVVWLWLWPWALIHGNIFTWQMINQCRCLNYCEVGSPMENIFVFIA